MASQYKDLPTTYLTDVRVVFADGREEKHRGHVLREHSLSVIANGETLKNIVCTRDDLCAVIVGLLYTERRIDAVDEIVAISFSDAEDVAMVRIRSSMRPKRHPATIKTQPEWESGWIFSLAKQLEEGLPLYKKTAASHSAFLARGGEILFAGEDISCHCALDKVVGHALLAGIPLSECLLFISGRVPADIVTKTISAQIPVLVTKAAPTSDAVKLARKYKLTLIGCAHEDSYTIY